MLKLNQLRIDPYLTVGDHFRFLEAKTAYVYEKGEATSKVKGYRCKLAMVDRSYDTFFCYRADRARNPRGHPCSRDGFRDQGFCH